MSRSIITDAAAIVDIAQAAAIMIVLTNAAIGKTIKIPAVYFFVISHF